jgi:hypothetical protein
MDSEFRLCPACRAPNTVQDAACTACGAPMPKVARGPVPTFEAIPGRQEVRQAARLGVRRGLLVGVVSAGVLGLLVARTFRSAALQDEPAQTAGVSPETAPSPLPTEQPAGMAPGAAAPVGPAGLAQPNPYAGANPAMGQPSVAGQPSLTGQPLPGAVPVSGPASPAASMPAVIIGAPAAGYRPARAPEATEAREGSKPASYTDADLARLHEGAAPTAAAPAAVPTAASPSPPARSPARQEASEARLRERREAVRAAQQRVDEAQGNVNDIRREARENDDDGLQEQLSDAVAELKSAQRDLARARRSLQEIEGQPQPVLPPQ